MVTSRRRTWSGDAVSVIASKIGLTCSSSPSGSTLLIEDDDLWKQFKMELASSRPTKGVEVAAFLREFVTERMDGERTPPEKHQASESSDNPPISSLDTTERRLCPRRRTSRGEKVTKSTRSSLELVDKPDDAKSDEDIWVSQDDTNIAPALKNENDDFTGRARRRHSTGSMLSAMVMCAWESTDSPSPGLFASSESKKSTANQTSHTSEHTTPRLSSSSELRSTCPPLARAEEIIASTMDLDDLSDDEEEENELEALLNDSLSVQGELFLDAYTLFGWGSVEKMLGLSMTQFEKDYEQEDDTPEQDVGTD